VRIAEGKLSPHSPRTARALFRFSRQYRTVEQNYNEGAAGRALAHNQVSAFRTALQ
jgi:hypothetical protein